MTSKERDRIERKDIALDRIAKIFQIINAATNPMWAINKLGEFIGKAMAPTVVGWIKEAWPTIKMKLKDKLPDIIEFIIALFENRITLDSATNKYTAEKDSIPELLNRIDVKKFADSLKKDPPKTSDKKPFTNHAPWWLPEAVKISGVPQNKELNEYSRTANVKYVKHYGFSLCDDIFEDGLAGLRSVVTAYFRRYTIYGSTELTDVQVNQYIDAIKALMHNSDTAYALVAEYLRSYNARHFKLGGYERFGKNLRPISYRTKLIEKEQDLEAMFQGCLNYYAPWTYDTLESGKGTATLLPTSEIVKIDGDIDATEEPWADEVWCEGSINNKDFTEILDNLRALYYNSKNCLDYFNYMLNGCFVNTKNLEACEATVFYFRDKRVWECTRNATNNGYIFKDRFIANGPIYSRFVRTGVDDNITNDLRILNSSDLHKVIKKIRDIQENIMLAFPGLKQIMRLLKLSILDMDIQKVDRNTTGPASAGKGKNVFEYNRRDTQGVTYHLHEMDPSFVNAAMNATVFTSAFPVQNPNNGAPQSGSKINLPYKSIITHYLHSQAEAAQIARDMLSLPGGMYFENVFDELVDYIQAQYSDKRAVIFEPDYGIKAYSSEAFASEKELSIDETYSAGDIASKLKWGPMAPLQIYGITSPSNSQYDVPMLTMPEIESPEYRSIIFYANDSEGLVEVKSMTKKIIGQPLQGGSQGIEGVDLNCFDNQVISLFDSDPAIVPSESYVISAAIEFTNSGANLTTPVTSVIQADYSHDVKFVKLNTTFGNLASQAFFYLKFGRLKFTDIEDELNKLTTYFEFG